MTWAEIKRAAEEAGVSDEEEVSVIQCERSDGGGDRTFHKVRLGNAVKLVENISVEKTRADAKGCAC